MEHDLDPQLLQEETPYEDILKKLYEFKDYSYIGRLVESEDTWYDRLERELIHLDSLGKINTKYDDIDEISKDLLPSVFKCSKFTYNYLDALYIVLVEGILQDHLLKLVEVDFIDMREKIQVFVDRINKISRDLTYKEKETLRNMKRILLAKKIDYRIVEGLIDAFKTKFNDIIVKNQEDDVLLDRLVSLRNKRFKLISNIRKHRNQK